jgi:hypothetical protein
MSGVFSIASHCGLQYFPDFATHVQGGCAHFLPSSAAIGVLLKINFGLWGRATAHEVKNQGDQRENQKQMDHGGGNVKDHKTSKPKHRQDGEKHNKYRRSSHSISSFTPRSQKSRRHCTVSQFASYF